MFRSKWIEMAYKWGNNTAIMRRIGGFGCLPQECRRVAFLTSSICVIGAFCLTVLASLSIDIALADAFPWSTSAAGSFASSNFKGTTQMWVGLRGIKTTISMTCIADACMVPMRSGDACPGQTVDITKMVDGGFLTLTGNGTAYCMFQKNQVVSDSFVHSFSDLQCDSGVEAVSANGYCESCKDACWTAFTTTLSTLLFIPMCLHADCQRSRPECDSNIDKVMGGVGNIGGGILTFVAMASFTRFCVDDLPSDFVYHGVTFGIAYKAGISYYALLLATGLLMLDGLIHLCMRTPEHCWSAELDSAMEIQQLLVGSESDQDSYGSLGSYQYGSLQQIIDNATSLPPSPSKESLEAAEDFVPGGAFAS